MSNRDLLGMILPILHSFGDLSAGQPNPKTDGDERKKNKTGGYDKKKMTKSRRRSRSRSRSPRCGTGSGKGDRGDGNGFGGFGGSGSLAV